MKKRQRIVLTIVTPVYNEETVIGHFHTKTRAALDALENVQADILYVADRCTDNTIAVLRDIVQNDTKARAIIMSSRFGQQMSLLAGIESSLAADAIVMMDSDLQHPPELIATLVSHFREGCEVVYTVRLDTHGIGALRKFSGRAFYWLLGKVSNIKINPNAADFRLISARVAKILATSFPERNMFLRGLFSWIGFKQMGVEYIAERRYAGATKYSFSRIWQFAISGILSFSTKPLQMGVFLGLSFAGLAFLLSVIAIIRFFVVQALPDGWTTLVILLLLFFGIQLIVLGIMGSYIGGIYEEVKRRPRYIIDETISHSKKIR